MPPETKNTLANAFAVVAIIAALVAATASAVTAVRLSNKIQAQRVENIVTNCQQQNARNRKAYVFLSKLPVNPNAPKYSPEQRSELIHGFTDALVGPIHTDCAAYAESLAHP